MIKIRFIGHAGFRLSCVDPDNKEQEKIIYIDPWLQSPDIPDDLKQSIPEDADIILITHGHFDHAYSAPSIIQQSKKSNPLIVCNGEINAYYKAKHGIKEEQMVKMNKGGQIDFGFCTVQMVSADHSSNCSNGSNEEDFHVGGEPCGYVINFGEIRVYHAGDTNVFGDMAIIDYLYQPTHVLVPIGSRFTMGPREAEFAVCRYFTHAQIVIPMHFQTVPLIPGSIEEFRKEVEFFSKEFNSQSCKIIDPRGIKNEPVDIIF